MAWNAKPSATMKIATRDEPYLTDTMKARYEKDILPRYERTQGATMPILHDVQETYGYIPHQAMIEIATLLNLAPGDVLDTASFYEEFHVEPVGTHVIAVCQSIACEVCGHQALLDHLQQKLRIKPHETTGDGRFTLLALECLGACDGAPCALINDDRHDNLTIETLDELLDKLP
jgi:NADH-quinone oxidoreductase subunit E